MFFSVYPRICHRFNCWSVTEFWRSEKESRPCRRHHSKIEVRILRSFRETWSDMLSLRLLDLTWELNKLCNEKRTIIPIVIGARGTVTKGLVQRVEDLHMLQYWEESWKLQICCRSNSSEKPSVNAVGKKIKEELLIIIIIITLSQSKKNIRPSFELQEENDLSTSVFRRSTRPQI